MFKLTPNEIVEREAFGEVLNAARKLLEKAVKSYNQAMVLPYAGLASAIDSCEQAMENANDWRDGVHKRLNEEYSAHSSRWQAGERGQLAAEMIEKWSNEIDAFPLAETDLPVPIELDDMPADGTWFEDYPEEIKS